MKLLLQSPKKALKAFLKRRPLESERDKFKFNLIELLDKINVIENQPKDESEEHLKNNLRDFLRDTYYIETNAINTKDTKDLVIHTGKTTDTDVAVIIEAKRPSNVKEMVSADNANKKGLHELILYYLDERNQSKNFQLKQLVITNIYEWFIIDANQFDKHIYRNTQIKKLYETKLNDKKDNPWFYEEISKIVSKIEDEIHCVHFDIRDYDSILRNNITEDDKELVALYKILSPQYLLKIDTPNDRNTLNERFYKELLHIIGLEEAREGTKHVIRRKKENKNAASLIELTIEALKTENSFHRIPDIKVYGENKEEQTFNIALELCITWINRILFLKLLEGQLISYHQGNKDYRFLNSETIKDYDELFKLFHKVLAINIQDRTEANKTKYNRVPYLNSSLFEISELEDQTIKINSLENDGQLELINTTVLKEIRKKAERLPTSAYLFQFLDAYDFAGEGAEDWQKDYKQLINASVLGKVFEKINGYRDGSIFTPAFITMYMCRQSIRLAVVEKFNEVLSGKNKKLFDKFDDVKNYTSRNFKTDEVLKANEIINSLHICDPSVGSGHFLVSALNEIIAIKSELGVLCDEQGNVLNNTVVEIFDDELYIYDKQTYEPFAYIAPQSQNKKLNYQFGGDKFENIRIANSQKQKIQNTLFHQKVTIIENCLFGVDINPKSVLICRLRLWIELLKNAYYREPDFTELETLPNIDINIKCGNSLLSRFTLDADLSKALKSINYDIKAYRGFVNDYKNEKNRDVKKGLQKIIDRIKSDFRTEIFQNDPLVRKLNKLQYEYNLLVAPGIFKSDVKDDMAEYGSKENLKKAKERLALLENEIADLTRKIENIKNNTLYKHAFEWRFEFPEVLNNKGEFEGFDLIIGNPPYGVSIKDNLRAAILHRFGKVPDYEIYYYFINLSKSLLKLNGIKSYIIPNTILFNVFAKGYRENLFNNWQIQEILDCTDFNVFEGSATVRCIITQFINKKSNDIVFYRQTANVTSFNELIERKLNTVTKDILIENNRNWALVFKLSPDVLKLVSKIKFKKKSLKTFFPEFSQGLIAYDKYQGQDEQTIKNRIFHSMKKQKGWQKWLWGEDVTPYMVKWNEKEYINYCDGIANPREPKYFKDERILIREISNPKIFAGYTIEESYNDPAIINIIKNKKGNFELKTLLAILNSKLATFYHFNSSPKATKGAFPKILIEDVKTFPLPDAKESDHIKIVKLVDKIISLKQQGTDSSEQEKKIDELVYKLYNISADEQKIIEGIFFSN